MSTYEIIRIAHAVIGTAALASFWTAGLAKKGRPVHRAAGKVYLATMAAVIASGVPMTIIIALSGRPNVAAFLGYLLVITAAGVWQSWRAVADKRDFAAYTGSTYKLLARLNVGAGLAILALGLMQKVTLFAGFSLVGIIGGVSMLRYAKRGPEDARWHLREHLGAMLGNGVATHIAFLSIGLPRMVPALQASAAYQLLAWFGPLAVAVVLRFVLRARYAPLQSQRSSRTNTAPDSTLTGSFAVGS
jgi:hypothetical protein